MTARNRGDLEEVPLCGFPAHAAQPYVARLAKGHTVAVCEQSPGGAAAHGARGRPRHHPGTILEEESLEPGAPSLLAAPAADGDRFGIAAIDFATGAFRTTAVDGWDAARDELERLAPRELLLAPDLAEEVAAACRDGRPWATAALPDPAPVDGDSRLSPRGHGRRSRTSTPPIAGGPPTSRA
jgi:DNA mismatch repair protein MutS